MRPAKDLKKGPHRLGQRVGHEGLIPLADRRAEEDRRAKIAEHAAVEGRRLAMGGTVIWTEKGSDDSKIIM